MATQRKEVSISHEAFEEFTNALNEAGIKLEKDDEILIKKDVAIKGPILYRQVNLRHQVMMEVAKVYKTPVDVKDFEVNDVNDFVNFLDTVYQYVLTGEKPASNVTPITTATKPKSAW